MFLVLFGTVCMFLPLAMYGLFIAWLNFRRQPTMVPGPWDFAGVLFGMSGFVAFAGPAILTGFDEHWRVYWMRGSLAGMTRLLVNTSGFWYAVFIGYFLTVVLAAAWVLHLRRGMVSVYNVRLEQFLTAFTAVAARLQLGWQRTGNRIVISLPTAKSDRIPAHQPLAVAAGPSEVAADAVNSVSPEPVTADLLPPGGNGAAAAVNGMDLNSGDPEGTFALLLDPFPVMGHLTLSWQNGLSDSIRYDVEAELARELAVLDNDPTPACGWIASVAVSLLSLVFFTVLLTVIALFVNVH